MGAHSASQNRRLKAPERLANNEYVAPMKIHKWWARKAMRLLPLCVSMSLHARSASVFELELWPDEGRPSVCRGKERLELRAQPVESTKIVSTWTGRTGANLAFDATLYYRTRTPGFVVARTSASITGRDFADATHVTRSDYYSSEHSSVRVEVIPGQVFEYLQDRAEGTCFVRVSRRVIEADLGPVEPSRFTVRSSPRTEWWIHITQGSVRGWLLTSRRTAD